MILIGPPGAGKGTLASLLEIRLGAKSLSSGVIFRSEIDAQTDLGELAKSYIDRGELVPNGVTIQMMIKRIRSEEVRHRGFILDGFPRTVRQAEALREELDKEGIPLNMVILLEAEEDIVVGRLSGRLGCTKCGEIYHSVNKPPKREGFCDKCNNVLILREDDNPETVRRRLRVYAQATRPVVDFYRECNLLLEVDGGRTTEEIYATVIKELGL